MAPGKKSVSSRPPVRAKSALPAPKVAPKRVHTPLLRRRSVQAVLAVLVVGLAALGVWRGLRFWHHHQGTQKAKAGVKAFDSQYQAQLTPLYTVLDQIGNSPQQFQAGLMPQPTYVSQTAQWLESFRAFAGQMQSAKAPAAVDAPRALLVQATDVFIDGVTILQLAGSASDLTLRKQLIEQGRNIIFHASGVFKNAQVEEAKVVAAYHLGKPPAKADLTPVSPPETAAPAPSPTPTSPTSTATPSP